MYFAFDEFEFDGTRLELRRHGVALKVERLALRLLAALLRDPGKLVTKDTLVTDVWSGKPVADNAITVTVARLRRALDDRRGEREFVATVYGSGYRFVRPVTRSTGAPLLPAPPVGGDHAPPFVGRAPILSELRHAALEARHGRGRVCVVMGEPGVGKTCLVRHLTDELAGGAGLIAWGFCREAGSTPPLSPWLQLADQLLKTLTEAHEYQTIGAVSELLKGLLQKSKASVPAGGEEPRDRPLDDTTAHLWSFAHAFLTVGAQVPLVLVVEDLHRADAASLEVLSLLVDEIGRARILVLATIRETPSGRSGRASTALPYVLGHSNTSRLPLRRLAEGDVLEYVAASIDDPDGKLARAVYAKSQGNPFFMSELVRQLCRDETADEATRAPLELPDAARDVIRRHVAALDADTRALLTAASVLGMRFDLSVLQTVTGREASDIARPLDHAIANDLVIAAPDSPTAFSFSHELVRAALYEALPPDERRRRHLETALAIERHAKLTHVPIHPSELADHFYSALPDTDLEKTVRYCDEAALAAGAVMSSTDTVRHLKQALAALLALPDPSPTLRINLLMRLAIFTRSSEPEEFLRAIREVAQLARERNDVPSVLRASIMCHAHPELSALPGASEALEHALAIIPRDEPGKRACALAVLATAPPRAFSIEGSRASLREAEQLLASNPGVTLLHRQVVLLAKLFLEGGPGSEPSFTATVDQLNQIWVRAPKRAPMVPLFIALNRTLRAHQRGQIATANAALAGGLASARELRHPELVWVFERFEALTQINVGESEAGRQRLRELHRQAARRPMLGSALFCAFDRAVVLPALGEQALDLDELRDTLGYQPWDTPGLWALKVRALATAGLSDEARASLEVVSPSRLASLPLDSQYVGTLGHLVRAALILKSTAYAETLFRLLTPLDDYFASHSAYFCEGAVPQLRGMLARLLGRTQEAHELLARGVRMCDEAGFVGCAVESRLELARCTLALSGGAAPHTAWRLTNDARGLAQKHQLPLAAARATELLTEIVSATLHGDPDGQARAAQT